MGSAFVGVSLDSDLFTRSWVRFAIAKILEKHRDILFVLGDRLLVYNKIVTKSGNGDVGISIDLTERRIEKRTSDIRKFLEAEIARLPDGQGDRVRVSAWKDYSNSAFAEIYRILSVAYCAIGSFRECVESDVATHLSRVIDGDFGGRIHRDLCALYVVEETAMILNITENGHPYEFYPQQHIRTLTELCDGAFASYGLTVDSLVGHPKQRVFTPLPEAVDDSSYPNLEIQSPKS
jgi:hypothetical protein